MAKMRYASLSTLKMIRINIGKARLANMELKETNLVINRTIRKIPTQPKGGPGRNPKHQSKKCGNTFTAPEFCPHRENMAQNSCQSKSYLKIGPGKIILLHNKASTRRVLRPEGPLSISMTITVGTPAGTQNPESIGGTGISTSIVADIDIELTTCTDPYRSGHRSYKIGQQDKDEFIHLYLQVEA